MTQKFVVKITATFRFPDGRDNMLALKLGDALDLVREPDNQFDANALKVCAGGPNGYQQLGYVPAAITPQLTGRRIVGCKKTGRDWDEITIEVV